MYTDIRTEPCVAHHRDSDILNTSYNQLPFYFNAHKKEPSDLSSRRKVERHPDYNHLNHQQRNEDDTEELEARVEQSDVPIKRTVVGCFKDFPSKGCTFSSTKVLGGLLTTALVVSCLALLLAIIALSIRGKPSLSSGINGLQLMDEIKQLQSQVGIIQEKQNLMNNSINEQKLTKEIEHLQNQVEALQESQTTLRSLVDTLKNQVNSQIDLYQNCIEETRSCVMGQNQPNLFRRECVTGQVPIEEPGYYTINMRCDYDSNRFFLETAYLRRSGDQVGCVCEVTYPLPDSAGHAVLSNDLQSTCNLVVTRCPQSQQIFNQT